MNNWIKVSSQLPVEGTVVETKISDDKGERNHKELIRKGNLWFLADMRIYVYYTPTHWRAK